MARPERFELPTLWFVARYSIQLSYGRVIKARIMAIEPGDVNPFPRSPAAFQWATLRISRAPKSVWLVAAGEWTLIGVTRPPARGIDPE